MRKLISGLIITFGFYWVWGTLAPPIRSVWLDGFMMADFIFFLTIVPMMAIPGIIAIFLGLRLFQEMEEKTVKWLTGVAVAFWHSTSLVFQPIYCQTICLKGFLIILSFFMYSCSYPALPYNGTKILKHLSYEVPSFTSLLNKNIFILLALQIWMILFNAFEEYAPIKEGYTHIKKEPWELSDLFFLLLLLADFIDLQL